MDGVESPASKMGKFIRKYLLLWFFLYDGGLTVPFWSTFILNNV